jgi:shikimate kinase
MPQYGTTMNLILIVGPPAIGKMAVGQALAAKTGYKGSSDFERALTWYATISRLP